MRGRYPGACGSLKRPMLLYMRCPGGAKSRVVSSASKRDQGLEGEGWVEGVCMIKSKSASYSAFQNKLVSTKRSRTSIPARRKLLTTTRTIDSQSVQPVGDLTYSVGSFLPSRSRVSTSSPSGPNVA